MKKKPSKKLTKAQRLAFRAPISAPASKNAPPRQDRMGVRVNVF